VFLGGGVDVGVDPPNIGTTDGMIVDTTGITPGINFRHRWF